MGADIHMYLNYTLKEESKDSNKKTYWRNFGDEICVGRNYLMFGCLCQGVREDIEGAIEPKGKLELDDMSYSCFSDSISYISSKKEDVEDNYCRLEDALRWSELYGKKLYYKDSDTPYAVDNPDHHSYSWLTLKEYKKAIKLFYKNVEKGGKLSIEYLVLKDLMESLEKRGAITKLVFWFDN